jgi:hypothetical protein
MATLCLKISPQMYANDSVVLGVSIDEQRSQAAEGLGQAGGATPAPVHQEVTINTTQTRVVDLQAVTATGEPARVVVAISGSDGFSFNLGLTLTPDSELVVRSTTHAVFLVSLTPMLARLAPDTTGRCRARLEDTTRCPLMKVQSGWCLAHLEHKALLHDELLEPRKAEFDKVKLHLRHRNAPNDQNIELYNTFQEMLALRPIITEVLYEGDLNDGHADMVDSVRKFRGEVASELHRNESDATGRVFITHAWTASWSRPRPVNTTRSGGKAGGGT